MRKLFYTLNAGLCLLLVPDTIAQQTTSDSTHQLNEVVISANKVEEKKEKVVQQIEVISAKQIAASNAQSTADLMQSTGQIAVQKSQQGGGSPVIRGFEASRILLVIDGVRMNNIVYRGGHLQNIITVDNAMLDRAEILFGPASTTYGSDALGGAICFYTKKPSLAAEGEKSKLKVNAFYRYGDVNNESTGHVDFSIGNKKIAALTSFTYSNFGDLRGGTNQNPFYKGAYGERPYYVQRFNDKDSLVKNVDRFVQKQSAYTQYDFMEKLLYQQNEHVSHQLNLQYSNSSDVPRYDRLTDPSGTGLRFAEWYYGPQTRLLAAYDLETKNENSFFQQTHLNLNYQNIEESRVSRRFNSRYLDSRIEQISVMGANFDVQHSTEKHQLIMGVDFQFNDLTSTANRRDILADTSGKLDTRYPDGDNTLLNLGFHVSHTWQINDQLVLNDGIRVGYSALHSTFVDTTFFPLPFKNADQKQPVYSGSIGLNHKPSSDLQLSLLLSTGYRVPNVDDLAKVFESTKGTVIVPNADLKAEKTVTTELGITKFFGKNTSWQNNVYYTQFYDAIVTDKFSYNGKDSVLYNGTLSKVMASQNKRKAYIYGFSTVLKKQWTEQVSMDAALNYTYGRIKTDSTDTPLDHIPPMIGRLAFNYDLGKFSSTFFIQYNAWKRLKDYYLNGEDNEQYATADGMPAWYTANFRLSYKVWKYITVQAGVDNIFDTQYRTFSSGINAPGRNVFGALRFSY